MKKIITLILISLVLSGCSLLRTHKMDIEQGNVITQKEVDRLHPGMTEAQVKDIMGSPVLINIFTPNRMDYVYTFKTGYGDMQEKRIVCVFRSGKLREIEK